MNQVLKNGKMHSGLRIMVLAGLIGWGAVRAVAAADLPSEMKLPPGWKAEDMQACMAAGTPGEQHQKLAKGIGVWKGQCQHWMPGVSEAMKSETQSKVSSFLDGRFIKVEVSGDMPGMGKYQGMGLYGYSNVDQKYVATWCDNMSTSIMHGTGDASSDGKTMTWTYEGTCPITKKTVKMREVQTSKSPTSMTLEMYGEDPKTGKEFKMMQIDMTKSE